MKAKLLHTIKTKPVFLYLVSVFFVLHGFTENYDFIVIKDALLLTAIYIGASLLLMALSWLIYRDLVKASLFAFLLMVVHFFFGFLQDELKSLFPGRIWSRYSFILPALAVLLLIAAIVLKRKKRPPYRTTFYLNTLFLVLILADTGWLVSKIINQKKSNADSLPAGLTACPQCTRPDIWFILADEYAGNTELRDIFHFDDSVFNQQLQSRNFHIVPESYSNYNYTPFSLASMLNLDYLQLTDKDRGKTDLTYCYEMIRNNKLLQFLQYSGYDFYNYSIFDFKGQPARTNETFLPANTRLITSQTLLSRLEKDMGFNLVTRLKSKRAIRRYAYSTLNNNNNLYEATWNMAGRKTSSPKFVYTHLMMPHYPYYFDKDGKEQPFETITEGNQQHRDAYISYLQYSNQKLLALVDHILRSSENPPIIILMGDHGFRHFIEPVPSKYYFLNLLSVHLPSNNYAGFTDSLTCVNLFRTFLNSQFSQHLPLLKDSTTYLKD